MRIGIEPEAEAEAGSASPPYLYIFMYYIYNIYILSLDYYSFLINPIKEDLLRGYSYIFQLKRIILLVRFVLLEVFL